MVPLPNSKVESFGFNFNNMKLLFILWIHFRPEEMHLFGHFIQLFIFSILRIFIPFHFLWMIFLIRMLFGLKRIFALYFSIIYFTSLNFCKLCFKF